MEEELKAGHAVEPASEIQLSAIVTGAAAARSERTRVGIASEDCLWCQGCLLGCWQFLLGVKAEPCCSVSPIFLGAQLTLGEAIGGRELTDRRVQGEVRNCSPQIPKSPGRQTEALRIHPAQ